LSQNNKSSTSNWCKDSAERQTDDKVPSIESKGKRKF